MPSKLVELEARAAIRYLNYDYREYRRLRDMAMNIYRQMEKEEAEKRRLKVPIGEIIKWKRERVS